MTTDQEKRCKQIIHTHAALAAAGNIVPIPGVGLAADLGTMTTMTMLLASELGGDIPTSVARNLSVAGLKKMILRQPLKMIAASGSKYVPFIGTGISASFSVAMLEAAGWSLAKELDRQLA